MPAWREDGREHLCRETVEKQPLAKFGCEIDGQPFPNAMLPL
jgi:hypothetical protein